jgi:hypothetical protein
MDQNQNYIVRNDKIKGFHRLIGNIIRRMPFSHLIKLLPIDDQMMKVASGLNEAFLPLALVKRIVASAPAGAFDHSLNTVRMDGGKLIDILEVIENEPMSLRARYAVIDALSVGWAAQVFTFVGDVTLQADQATIDLANRRGSADGFARAEANRALSRHAAALSKRPLSQAA